MIDLNERIRSNLFDVGYMRLTIIVFWATLEVIYSHSNGLDCVCILS